MEDQVAQLGGGNREQVHAMALPCETLRDRITMPPVRPPVRLSTDMTVMGCMSLSFVSEI